MAFTYAIGTDRGKVRLRIGDTVEQTYSIVDDEIDYSLTLTSDNLDRAAVRAHEWLIARLADWIAQSAGGQSKQLQQKYEHHLEMHKLLKSIAREQGSYNAYAGGIEQDRIDDAKEDTTYPQPFSAVGMDDRDYDVVPPEGEG